jgi:hypothetical protein
MAKRRNHEKQHDGPFYRGNARAVARSRRRTRYDAVSNRFGCACERYLADETIVGELEARLAATAVRALTETAKVEDDVQLVIAQIDQLIRFVFQATPEIFDKESAGILGSRRYSGFLKSFPKEFQSRKRRAVFATKIDETEDDKIDSGD